MRLEYTRETLCKFIKNWNSEGYFEERLQIRHGPKFRAAVERAKSLQVQIEEYEKQDNLKRNKKGLEYLSELGPSEYESEYEAALNHSIRN